MRAVARVGAGRGDGWLACRCYVGGASYDEAELLDDALVTEVVFEETSGTLPPLNQVVFLPASTTSVPQYRVRGRTGRLRGGRVSIGSGSSVLRRATLTMTAFPAWRYVHALALRRHWWWIRWVPW